MEKEEEEEESRFSARSVCLLRCLIKVPLLLLLPRPPRLPVPLLRLLLLQISRSSTPDSRSYIRRSSGVPKKPYINEERALCYPKKETF